MSNDMNFSPIFMRSWLDYNMPNLDQDYRPTSVLTSDELDRYLENQLKGVDSE